MQSRLRLEDSVVSLTVPVRVAVHKPAADESTEEIAEQAGDVDQADDGRAEIVWRYLQDEGVEDVNCYDPGESDAKEKSSIDDAA